VTFTCSLFGWLVADGWCWFILREEYCWLVASGWFVLREKYCWLVADKPSEQGDGTQKHKFEDITFRKKIEQDRDAERGRFPPLHR
jgi:hypothetical protein